MIRQCIGEPKHGNRKPLRPCLQLLLHGIRCDICLASTAKTRGVSNL
jgi:hypothetical protein